MSNNDGLNFILISSTNTEAINAAPPDLPEYSVPGTDPDAVKHYKLETKNFQGGFTVSVQDKVSTDTAVAMIIGPDGQTAKFPTAIEVWASTRVKMCRLLNHLYSLTDDQCKQFIKDQNGGKGHKPKKEKK